MSRAKSQPANSEAESRVLICDPSSLEYIKLSYHRVIPGPIKFLIFGKGPHIECYIYIVANNT